MNSILLEGIVSYNRAMHFLLHICRLRDYLEQLAESYPIKTIPQLIVRDTYGCALYPALPDTALTFTPDLENQIILLSNTTHSLSITLPSSLSSVIGGSHPALTFCAFKNEALFVRREAYLNATGQQFIKLASKVVLARLSGGVAVKDLNDPITISFTQVVSVVAEWIEFLMNNGT